MGAGEWRRWGVDQVWAGPSIRCVLTGTSPSVICLLIGGLQDRRAHCLVQTRLPPCGGLWAGTVSSQQDFSVGQNCGSEISPEFHQTGQLHCESSAQTRFVCRSSF